MSKNVEVLFIRSDGKRLAIDGTDYKITAISGIGAPANSIYTKTNAVGDGEVITGHHVVSEDFTLDFCNENTHLNNIYRKQILSFFNVKYFYKFYVTYLGSTKWSEGQLFKNATASLNVYEKIDFSLIFMREQPFWCSVDEFAHDIAGIIPKYGYPLYDIPDVGFAYDTFHFAKNVLIDNDGDTECYCKAVLVAKGTVIKPELIKNGKYVKILDTMNTGDTYILDFVNMSVTKNGFNAIVNIDKGSSFTDMQFDVGENIISYDCEFGDNVLTVTLYFNKLYGGVY